MLYIFKFIVVFVVFCFVVVFLVYVFDKVFFGINWFVQVEYGGYYQVVVDGIYKKYGLDVIIVQGGLNVVNSVFLIFGKIEFYMGGEMGEFNVVKQGILLVDVVVMFQKDLQILMVYFDQGIDKFEDFVKFSVIFMGKDGYLIYFEWMKVNFKGFKDEQYKFYNFNFGLFIVDKKFVQQGYLMFEFFVVEKQVGWKLKVFLFVDNGFSFYLIMVMVKVDLIKINLDFIQCFVDVLIEGWYNYFYGDNKVVNDFIKKENLEMMDEQIVFFIVQMKEYGILEFGEVLIKGIGCMMDEKYKVFFDEMVKIKFFDVSMDYKKVFIMQFVCKGVGMVLKK